MPLMNLLSHEYLWSPTPVYYLGSMLFYTLCKNKLGLKHIGFVPVFFAVPATLDYIKRDFYIKSFAKEYAELSALQRSVKNIVDEKKNYVTFEQVMRYCFRLNLDKVTNQRSLLPISAF